MPNWQSYKDVRICVYAMAADEPEAFIDRWLDSMKGADIITVLVTKKDNPNFRYFKEKQQLPEFHDKLIVWEEDIKPWRFDTARNESMKLIPEDECDVCVCTDIDEILIEDFWDDLRKVVFEHPNFDRILYQYAWSHDDKTGEPKWYFWYDKIHRERGWRWDYPVHEALICPDKEKLGYEGIYRMDANKIYLHHYPDKTKSRGNYLGLLELRAKEYPDDLYGLYYLAREYTLHNQPVNAINTAFNLYVRLQMNKTLQDAIACDDMMMLPALSCLLADMLKDLGMLQDAEYFYKRATVIDPTFRDGYMKLAQLYAYQPNKFNECYQVLDEMEKKSIKKTDWRLDVTMWRDWKKYQVLADAACWEGNYDKAYELILKALQDIKTEDDKNDASTRGFYNDLNFILNKKGISCTEAIA